MIPNSSRPDQVSKRLTLATVLLLGALSLGLVITPSTFMVKMIRRADLLSQISDPIQRDQQCINQCATARALDRAIDPQARIFITGMLGTTNNSNLGYYFFLRNYLFPRDIGISLGTNLVYREDGFHGTPCDSSAILKSNGFDLVINYNNFQMIALTPRGRPK